MSSPPKSRFGRLAKLGAMGLKAATGDNAAKIAADGLKQMRGLAAKVGQMAAYIDGVAPEAHREWFRGLLDATTASPYSEVEQLVLEETGKPLSASFAEFEQTPIASASIGQVHRARLLDGREVAVKVQHPGIAEAVAADLKNAGFVESALALAGTRKFESKRVLAEIRARFTEELDYTLEASRQRYFRACNADLDRVWIPEIIDPLSTKRMLTMEFVRGVPLETLTTRSEAERRAAAETMWLVVYRMSLEHGMFNADPHPGNFLFCDDGRVAFLDFGCVQVPPVHLTPTARAVHTAAGKRDEAEFRRLAPRLLETRGGPFEQASIAYLRQAFEPQFRSPFRITRDYVAGLVKQFKDAGVAAAKSKGDDVTPMPEGVFFMNRLQFGFYSVLARLDVEVDYRALERSFLRY